MILECSLISGSKEAARAWLSRLAYSTYIYYLDAVRAWVLNDEVGLILFGIVGYKDALDDDETTTTTSIDYS